MLGMSRLKTICRGFVRSWAVSGQGLETRFFDDWHPELDEALQHLPEADIFPHELFRMLMKMSDPEKRKILLVTEGGEPVAVAGLRNRSGFWEPVTQWIVPGVLFPVKEGYIARVLAALGQEVRVAWWRWETPPPVHFWIVNAVSTPTHGMRCTEDFESYWRGNGHFKEIRKFRNRCRGFELKVNPPGGSDWTIRNWEARWRPQGIPEMPDLADRLAAARYLHEKGLYHSLLLYSGDEPAAGATMIIHRNYAVAHCSYRNPTYDWHGAMSRLSDLIFSWVKEMGFTGIDLGGSYDYKKEWAPESGQKWSFEVRPELIPVKMRASDLVSRVMKNLNGSPKTFGTTDE